MHAPGMHAAIVFLLQLFFCRRRRRLLPARFTFFSLSHLFFFLSLLPDRTEREREFAWGTRLLSDREAIDRASARWLPPKGRPNGPYVIEPRYFIAPSNYVSLCFSREQAFCEPSLPLFLSTNCMSDDWKIIYCMTCGYYEVQFLSH